MHHWSFAKHRGALPLRPSPTGKECATLTGINGLSLHRRWLSKSREVRHGDEFQQQSFLQLSVGQPVQFPMSPVSLKWLCQGGAAKKHFTELWSSEYSAPTKRNSIPELWIVISILFTG
jgi:hypothetical protein